MLKNKKIGFIGGGNMAEALIRGLMAGGLPATELSVAEPVADRRSFLAGRHGIKVTGDNREVTAGSDIIILSIKPQIARQVLAEISPEITSDKVVVSIMAGITTASIEAACPPGTRTVRVMPNTAALVLKAASAIAPGAAATSDDTSLTRRIFEMVGSCWHVEEKLLDAVTGLSGSGPAYVLTFIEALSDAGVKNGLPRDVAFGLAAQTVFGTAQLLLETHEHPALLKEKVTSPGGTTIAGLHILEKEGFRGAVMDAVDAATARSRELGGKITASQAHAPTTRKARGASRAFLRRVTSFAGVGSFRFPCSFTFSNSSICSWQESFVPPERSLCPRHRRHRSSLHHWQNMQSVQGCLRGGDVHPEACASIPAPASVSDSTAGSPLPEHSSGTILPLSPPATLEDDVTFRRRPFQYPGKRLHVVGIDQQVTGQLHDVFRGSRMPGFRW